MKCYRKISGICLLAGILMIGLGPVNLQAQLIYQEDFETDGEGTRYTVDDGDVYEISRIREELQNFDMHAPLYWAHSSKISKVAVAIDAPARRAILTWHASINSADVTDDAKKLLGNMLDWLTEGRTTKIAHFSTGGPGASGDDVIVELLQGKGFTVIDGISGAANLPDPDTIDLVIVSSAGADNTLTSYAAPLLTYNASGHDDLLVSTIGDSNQQLTIDNITITTPGGASGDLTGSFGFVNGMQSYDLIGVRLPEGAVVAASALFSGSEPVENLATVDDMISGAKASNTTRGDIFDADLFAGASGLTFPDISVPGDPIGGFATVGTGVLDVDVAGTYTFALGVDDGARLRIDVDGNGIDADDTIIEFDRNGGFAFEYGDVTFPSTGAYNFEWVAFNSVGDFGAEIWYNFSEGGGFTGPVDLVDWTHITDWRLFGFADPINLSGAIAVTTYVLDTPPVLVEAPLLVTIDEGVPLLGGLISGQSGEGFFAGAGVNKFGNGGTKTLTLNPVDVSGQADLKLSIMVAATDLDFETSDFLDVLVDANNSGFFEEVVSFRSPSSSDKFIQGNVHGIRIGNRFKTFVYDLPSGTDMIIRIEVLNTWFNEIMAFDNISIYSGDPPPPLKEVSRDSVAKSTGALEGPTIVDFGDLSGDASYEFFFHAKTGGASTALAGNDALGLKLDQWNRQGIFGTTAFGVVDSIFEGPSVESVFDRDVHVVYVNDTAAGEVRLYVDGVEAGSLAGNFELAGEGKVMAARISVDTDPMGEGSIMYYWATYDVALTAEEISDLASSAAKPLNIAFVSFHGNSATPTDDAAAAGFTEASDKGYTDLLEASGHTVTRVVTSNSPDIDALNQFDLVIISRAVSSGHYRNEGATGWTSVTTPTLILGGYVLRTSRMGFTSGTTMVDSVDTISLNVNNPDHPIFAGVALDADGNMVNDYAEIITFNDIVQRGVSVNNNDIAAGGQVLATVANAGDPTVGGLVIGEWQTGATLANDAANVLAGPRVVLLTGSREQGFTSQGAGIYDLVGDGAQLFLNSVVYTGGLSADGGAAASTSISMDADGNIVLTFEGDLWEANNVNGPYTEVGGASSPMTITPDAVRKFYQTSN